MARSSGLVGLYGHTYEDDEEAPGERKIQHQFRIRSMPAGRWVCQLFSFWDGRPSRCGCTRRVSCWART